MSFEPRVLPSVPVESLQAHLDAGGGAGLDAARKVEAEVIIGELEASGLRGRGGGGFATGTKWRTVAANRSDEVPTTVVVNAAEGEPGTFKDRAILRTNPYAVVEGALIAALAVGADRVIVAMKSDEAGGGQDRTHVEKAIAEVEAAEWCSPGTIEVFGGPGEYLYGEETALLEVLNGRPPFPRIAPPFRRGADEVVDDDVTDTDDAVTSTGAAVELAGPGDETPAPPALVNNVETLANVPAIIAKGAAWFREIGTNESPGSIVCTVTGSVHRHGVAEVPMGTTVADAIELIGGGAMRSAGLIGVLNGASNALLPATALSTPLTYEDMQAAGVGLGSASLTVLDEGDDLVAVAAGYARFLAVESCGQCTPCKEDGLAISDRLAALCADDADDGALDEIRARLATVADGARCNLARQTQVLVGSLVDANPAAFETRPDPDPDADPDAPPVEPIVVGEVADIVDDRAQLLPDAGTKQPDWTHDESWSGTYPAAMDVDGSSPRPA